MCTYGREVRGKEAVLAESEENVGLSDSTISDDEYFGQIIVSKVIPFHLKV